MINLVNPRTKMVKKCSTGYSWTTFFFGVFVPLFRGDLKWAAIFFIIAIMVSFVIGPLAFICGPIFGFFYNKLYISNLVEKGYVGNEIIDNNWLIENGIIHQ